MKITPIDNLIDDREYYRSKGNYGKSDEIRDYLDTKNVFIFDTKDGQEVYHIPYNTTREDLVIKINNDKRADKLFDAWLFSVKKK